MSFFYYTAVYGLVGLIVFLMGLTIWPLPTAAGYGIFAVLLFGVAGIVGTRRNRKNAAYLKAMVEKEHRVLFDCQGSLRENVSVSGGWLFVTEDAILYFNQGFSLGGSGTVFLPLSEITSIRSYPVVRIPPFGMAVGVKGRPVYHFTVADRKNCLRVIESAKAKSNGAMRAQ